MQGDYQSVFAPARRLLVVVLGDQRGDRLGQFRREGGPVRGGREADLAVDGERRQLFAGRRGAGKELAHLLDQTGGEGEHPPGRGLVPGAVRVRGDVGQCSRGDDVGARGGLQHPFGAVALASFLDQLDEAVLFQRAQVIVDLLPGQACLRGQCGGRAGLGQGGQ